MKTWYVMEDGSYADPREVSPDKKGLLRHKDGRAVAYAPHGPRSRSVPDEETGKPKPKGESNAREMKAEAPKAGYKTRDVKAG